MNTKEKLEKAIQMQKDVWALKKEINKTAEELLKENLPEIAKACKCRVPSATSVDVCITHGGSINITLWNISAEPDDEWEFRERLKHKIEELTLISTSTTVRLTSSRRGGPGINSM